MTPLEQLRIEKAASDCGFELTVRWEEGRAVLTSAAFPESVEVEILENGSFRVSSRDAGLLKSAGSGDGSKIDGYDALYTTLRHVSAAARTLPDRVAAKFQRQKVAHLGATEAERIVLQRVGQELFRAALIDYWSGQCCVTSLSVVSLLRASHIKPWAKCTSDEERLDVFNGLLLAPQVDALFDGGWISFQDKGEMLVSPHLPSDARFQLGVSTDWRLQRLAPGHVEYLTYHRRFVFRV